MTRNISQATIIVKEVQRDLEGGMKLVIPEYCIREVIVQVLEQQEDLVKRSSIQVVEVVNKAIRAGSALIVRRLPSRDTVITFDQKAESYTKDTKQVGATFREIVKLYYCKFTIIVKGLPVVYLHTVYSISEVLESLKKYTLGLSRYKVQLLRNLQGKFVDIILYIDSIVVVQQVYYRGVVYEAQIFNTEPYYTEAQVRHYFRYYVFRYITRYYSCTTWYRYCITTVYQGGEVVYPEREESRKKRYMNCNRRYIVQLQECLEALK